MSKRAVAFLASIISFQVGVYLMIFLFFWFDAPKPQSLIMPENLSNAALLAEWKEAASSNSELAWLLKQELLNRLGWPPFPGADQSQDQSDPNVMSHSFTDAEFKGLWNEELSILAKYVVEPLRTARKLFPGSVEYGSELIEPAPEEMAKLEVALRVFKSLSEIPQVVAPEDKESLKQLRNVFGSMKKEESAAIARFLREFALAFRPEFSAACGLRSSGSWDEIQASVISALKLSKR